MNMMLGVSILHIDDTVQATVDKSWRACQRRFSTSGVPTSLQCAGFCGEDATKIFLKSVQQIQVGWHNMP